MFESDQDDDYKGPKSKRRKTDGNGANTTGRKKQEKSPMVPAELNQKASNDDDSYIQDNF